MAHGQDQYELKMSSLGKQAKKVGKAVADVAVDAVEKGLQEESEEAPGQFSISLHKMMIKFLKRYIKKFLEKTVGVWTFPCVNSCKQKQPIFTTVTYVN